MKKKKWFSFDNLDKFFDIEPTGDGAWIEYDTDEMIPPAVAGWNKGIPHSDETRDKIRQKAKGRLVSKETRARMSLSRQGQKRPQSGAAISKALRGRVMDEEWKKKLSKAASKPSGRKMSYEQKKKMYEARWGKSYEQMLLSKENK